MAGWAAVRRRGSAVALVGSSAFVVLLLLAAGHADSALDSANRGLSPASPAMAQGKIERAYGRLPVAFEANRGQTDEQVDYLARGAGYSVFLTGREAVLSLRAPARGPGDDPPDAHPRGSATAGAVVRMRMLGANPKPTVGDSERLPGVSNYVRGGDPKGWRTGIPHYAKVRYQGVYPGTDVIYYGKQGRLEYDFVLAPGADPDAIVLSFRGAHKVSLDAQGSLSLETRAGRIRQEKPFIYQNVAGARKQISGGFVLERNNQIRFRVGPYDESKPLVIDPALAYSTYLGGIGIEAGNAIAADSSGSAYLAGYTNSADFPTQSPLDAGPPLNTDAFVTKLNPQGTALMYSTYLGGEGRDEGTGIVADAAGSAYVTGESRSPDFPTTPGAFDRSCGAGTLCVLDAFLTKLSPDGSALRYSTFLGGDDADFAKAIAIDRSGAAYVTGGTRSTNFPMESALQPNYGGGTFDAFVTKLDADGSSLAYSTYLGGEGPSSLGLTELGAGIAVDASGSAHVTGETPSRDFPTTTGALDRTCGAEGTCNGGNRTDAFVTKLSPLGATLDYSTYLGGAETDSGFGVALRPGTAGSDGAYLIGGTRSADFPTTEGSYDRSCAGAPSIPCADAFVAKLDGLGSRLDYATYLGGEGHEDLQGSIAVDSAGSAHVTGNTTARDFPTTRPVSRAPDGGAFVAKFRADGSGVDYSTLLGFAAGHGIALDPSGSAYVGGTTQSTNFATINAFQPRAATRQRFNRGEAFLAKLSPVDPRAPFVSGIAPRTGDVSGGRRVEITGTGLSATTAVSFGGVAASSYEVISDTRIVAVIPPHAEGAVPVTVTTPQGTSPPNPITRFVYGAGRWERTGSLSSTRQRVPTATLLRDGKVLVAGGEDGPEAEQTRSAELYDPATGSWSPAGQLNRAHEGHTATLLKNGKVLVVSGSGTPSAELYGPATGGWSPTDPPREPRARPTATLLPSGKVLLVGSFSDPSAELYDPESGTWTPTGAPAGADGGGHTATLLANGKVLVVGGLLSSRSAEVYDPATGRWTPTGSPRLGRLHHTATLLPSGKVLVVGGQGGNSDAGVRDTAEIYDPNTGTWTLNSTLQSPRSGHAATPLPGGRVLVAGGDYANSPLDTAELYDPALRGGQGGWRSAGVMDVHRPGPAAAWLGGDPGVCGSNCGKVLVVGSTDDRSAELYTPPPPDTTPPAPPTITSPANNSYDRDGNFSVAGTAEPGSTVRLYEGTTLRGQATAAPSGGWAVALAGVPDGRHTYIATATDGAGNPSSPSSPHTVLVDKIRPRVKAVSPAAGATGVSTAANVLARFSEPMRASTIARRTVVLVRKGTRGAVAAKVTYDPIRRRAKLDPNRALARGATYTATVTTGARDRAGNPLARAKSWRFKTRR